MMMIYDANFLCCYTYFLDSSWKDLRRSWEGLIGRWGGVGLGALKEVGRFLDGAGRPLKKMICCEEGIRHGIRCS